MCLILVHTELYMFQYLMLCMVYLFLTGCVTALAHFDPKLGLVWFQFDTQSVYSECRAAQIQGIAQLNFSGYLFQSY